MESRVELFAAIRRDSRVEDLSIRELADRHHVHRRTVRQALASAFPPARRTPVRVSRRLEEHKPVIDCWLKDDLEAPRKQRHTARRVLARLVDEQSAVGVSYSAVRDYVARRRPEIAAEAGRGLAQGCVPQTHEPGAEALCGIPHNASYGEPGNMRRRPRTDDPGPDQGGTGELIEST